MHLSLTSRVGNSGGHIKADPLCRGEEEEEEGGREEEKGEKW